MIQHENIVVPAGLGLIFLADVWLAVAAWRERQRHRMILAAKAHLLPLQFRPVTIASDPTDTDVGRAEE